MQDEADAQVKANAAAAGHYYACANSSTNDDALSGWAGGNALGDDEASAMRLALGLPIERT